MSVNKWDGINLTSVATINGISINGIQTINGQDSIQAAFVSSWKTDNAGTSSSTQITIPVITALTYNCVIEWGDGTSSNITTSTDPAWTHTYSSAGTYTVVISGNFGGLSFNNGGDRLKLLNISRWGSKFRLGTTQGNYFYGCANLTISATNILTTTGTTIFTGLFRNCTSLTTVPGIASWDVSSVTSMTFCFGGAILFNQSLSGWNTSSVTLMNSMFNMATVFNGDITTFNTSSVTNMANMFLNALAFNQNIGSWNTGNVTMMQGMFAGTATFNQNIGSWNTTSLLNTDNMFNVATAFNQNLGSWNISSLITAVNMFAGVTLSNANYNGLLAGWGAFMTPHNNVTFSGGNSHYDTTSGGVNGTAGRAILTGTYSWTITDGGTP